MYRITWEQATPSKRKKVFLESLYLFKRFAIRFLYKPYARFLGVFQFIKRPQINSLSISISGSNPLSMLLPHTSNTAGIIGLRFPLLQPSQ